MSKLKRALILCALPFALHYQAKFTLSAENLVVETYESVKQATIDRVKRKLKLAPIQPPVPKLSTVERLQREALRQGVNPQVALAIVHTETRGRHNSRSPVGAIGLMQIMPFNSKRCGLSSPDELWDIDTNIRCGIQILREELENYDGDIDRASRVYNGGPKALKVKIPESENYAAQVKNYLAKTTPTLLARN